MMTERLQMRFDYEALDTCGFARQRRQPAACARDVVPAVDAQT
jgi:hypothetical protein